MEEDFGLTDKQLRSITVPKFKAPEELEFQDEEISSVFHFDGKKIIGFIFHGISRVPQGNNPMMKVTSVTELLSGRVKDEFIIKAEMKMGELRTAVSIEITKSQLEEILKLGLRSHFGQAIDKVKFLGVFQSVDIYDLEVFFKGRV